MSDINIFEQASRAKLRFDSVKGQLVTEQLWDLPLQSKTNFDLDTVAKGISGALLSVGVDPSANVGVSNNHQNFLNLHKALV